MTVGGVGGFGVQLAAALGAHVVAIDVDEGKLEALAPYGAHHRLSASALDFKALKGAVRNLAKEHGVPSWRWRIFETSGTPAGQSTAFGLVGRRAGRRTGRLPLGRLAGGDRQGEAGPVLLDQVLALGHGFAQGAQ